MTTTASQCLAYSLNGSPNVKPAMGLLARPRNTDHTSLSPYDTPVWRLCLHRNPIRTSCKDHTPCIAFNPTCGVSTRTPHWSTASITSGRRCSCSTSQLVRMGSHYRSTRSSSIARGILTTWAMTPLITHGSAETELGSASLPSLLPVSRICHTSNARRSSYPPTPATARADTVRRPSTYDGIEQDT